MIRLFKKLWNATFPPPCRHAFLYSQVSDCYYEERRCIDCGWVENIFPISVVPDGKWH